MRSAVEILLGRRRAEWTARDRWILRGGAVFLGIFSFLFLRLALVLLHGSIGASNGFLWFLGTLLCSAVLVTLVERRIRSAPPPQ